MSVIRNSIFHVKTVRPLVLQFGEKLKWRDVLPRNGCKPFTTNVQNSTNQVGRTEWTDPNFSERFKQNLKQPKNILIGLYNFAGEFGKLYNETKENFYLNNRIFQCQDPNNLVEMLYTFDSDAELNKFLVSTDSSQFGGYSSASLKLTPAKTGLFSGYINTAPVQDGETTFTGYATMVSRKMLRSFKRIKYRDFSYYSHLVFKVKGDGRTYFIHFSVKAGYDQQQSWVFSYPLFTRGGPYWQVSKIPFSDFVFVSKGEMANPQPAHVSVTQIATLGLTTRQVEGPFKLEIDYIGLEYVRLHREISPYEDYA